MLGQSCKELVLRDGRVIPLAALSTDASINALLAGSGVKVFLHKDASGEVDGVHTRRDGKDAPKDWWLSGRDKQMVTA